MKWMFYDWLVTCLNNLNWLICASRISANALKSERHVGTYFIYPDIHYSTSFSVEMSMRFRTSEWNFTRRRNLRGGKTSSTGIWKFFYTRTQNLEGSGFDHSTCDDHDLSGGVNDMSRSDVKRLSPHNVDKVQVVGWCLNIIEIDF